MAASLTRGQRAFILLPGKLISTVLDATLMSLTGPLGRAPPRMPGEGAQVRSGLKGGRARELGTGQDGGSVVRNSKPGRALLKQLFFETKTKRCCPGPPHLSPVPTDFQKTACMPRTRCSLQVAHTAVSDLGSLWAVPQGWLWPWGPPGLGVRPEFPAGAHTAPYRPHRIPAGISIPRF